MKKLIHNNQNLFSRKLTTIVRTLGMLLLVGMSSIVSAQVVDCNITMACNDNIQVSLDENCVVVITPDMILEDPTYDESEYTVVLTTAAGFELPSTTVSYTYVNQQLSVNVSLNGCAAACWGNITIEDKLPPVFTLCENFIVECDDNLAPGGGVIPFPTVIDACSNVTDLDYIETEVTNACANDFVKTVTRIWTAHDEQGNEASCTQMISVKKASIDDVVFPPNYDDIDQPAFTCGTILDLLDNGAPSPIETGMPSGATCPNIQTYYNDVISIFVEHL